MKQLRGMNKKLNTGDLLAIETKKGIGYLYLVKLPNDKNDTELVKVFYQLFEHEPKDLNDIINRNFYYLQLPIHEALRQNLVKVVGNLPLSSPNLLPRYFRVENVFGEGWAIVDSETWKREVVTELTEEQKQLSPWDIISFPDLVERLENNWR